MVLNENGKGLKKKREDYFVSVFGAVLRVCEVRRRWLCVSGVVG